GDFQTEYGSYYVGNFASGSSEYFEGMVIPYSPGEVNGAVVFTYEDSTGQMQEVRKEFTLNVMEMPPMEEFPSDMPPMEGFDPNEGGIKGMLKSKWTWIGLVVVLAVVGGIVFYRKKKKAKEMAFDE
ncbi:MAG: LPXTG cell wall anchor domain-containing protein, partial [Tissierellia bacterium]|nr:LPXTG cell wall anchor domain-containing protein [Tissierellia bacterium]